MREKYDYLFALNRQLLSKFYPLHIPVTHTDFISTYRFCILRIWQNPISFLKIWQNTDFPP